MINVCGAAGGMWLGRQNPCTQKKLDPVPRFPPQIPDDLNWDRIRAAAVVYENNLILTFLESYENAAYLHIQADDTYSNHGRLRS
jgi:hypothetical protein